MYKPAYLNTKVLSTFQKAPTYLEGPGNKAAPFFVKAAFKAAVKGKFESRNEIRQRAVARALFDP